MTDEAPLGQAVRDGDRLRVRFERHLTHDRDKVWRALTESAHLAAWFPCDIVGERRAGATILLPFWPDHVAKYGLDGSSLKGEIRVWDPPSVFEWTWATDVLRWELTPTPGGTRLVFTTWLDDDPRGAAQAGAGYHVCLEFLTRLLDTGSPGGRLVDADVAPWERRYEEAMSALA